MGISMLSKFVQTNVCVDQCMLENTCHAFTCSKSVVVRFKMLKVLDAKSFGLFLFVASDRVVPDQCQYGYA